MINRKHTLESFQDRRMQEHLIDAVDLGVRTVEVSQIVGSVNRWQDFDAGFRMRLKNKSARHRLDRIRSAMKRGEILPPVVLYKAGDQYYVVDGNHRVAAAKQLGQVYIDAYVTEYLPQGDTPRHLLWRERSAFERKTRLSDIELTQLGLYPKLLEQIEHFRTEEAPDLPLHQAAQSWYVEIYQPVVKEVEKERLLLEYPGRTAADLFLYATYHRMTKTALTGESVTYREALADFHATPHRTLAEKIFTVVNHVLHLTEDDHRCPYGLLLDEDGFVRVTKNCGGCDGCTPCFGQESRIIGL